MNQSTHKLIRPLARSPSAEVDVAEADEHLPSVINNTNPQFEPGMFIRLRQQEHIYNIGSPPTEVNKLGYLIHPEEYPGHPKNRYGRGKDGRSLRIANVARTTATTLGEFAKKLHEPNRTDDLVSGLEALLTECAVTNGDDVGYPDGEGFDKLLAGFGTTRSYSYEEACCSEKRNQIEAAMRKEADRLLADNFWSIVDLPEGKEAIETAWSIEETLNAEGETEQFKARVEVVQESQEVQCRDNTGSKTSYLMISTFRLFLAFVSAFNLKVRQINVVGALEDPVKDEIYVTAPPGVPFPTGKVFRLHKALRGLQQTGLRAGLEEYRDKQLVGIGWRQSKAARGLFTRIIPWGKGKHQADLSVWFGDTGIIGIRDDMGERRTEEFIKEVAGVLSIEDNGTPRSFLGMSLGGFDRRPDGKRIIYAHQSGLIDHIVDAARMQLAEPTLTPLRLDYHRQISPTAEGEAYHPLHRFSYPELISAINHIARCTRPDISNAARVLAAQSDQPSAQAWTALNHMIAYLKTTRDYVLAYGVSLNPFYFDFMDQAFTPAAESFVVFCDAEWVEEPDRVSIMGFVTLFEGNLVNWGSRKNNESTARNSMAAEIVATCNGVKESERNWRILAEVLDTPSQMNIVVDNHVTKYFENASSDHTETEATYFDTQCYLIKQAVNDKSATLWYCSSVEQPADLLTKPLSRDRHALLMLLLGMRRLEEVR